MSPQPTTENPFPNSQVPERYQTILDAYAIWASHASWAQRYAGTERISGDFTSPYDLRNGDLRFLVCPDPVTEEQRWNDVGRRGESVHDFLDRTQEALAKRLPEEISRRNRLKLVYFAWQKSPKIDPSDRGFPSKRAFTDYLKNLCEWEHLSRQGPRGPYRFNPRRALRRWFDQPISTRRLIGLGFLHGYPENLSPQEQERIERVNEHIGQAIEILAEIRSNHVDSFEEAMFEPPALLTLPIPAHPEKFPKYEQGLKAMKKTFRPPIQEGD